MLAYYTAVFMGTDVDQPRNLAKVDVDKEQQLAGYFQIRSVPTVMLVKGGQIVDGFPGALPEGQVRQFLEHHGVDEVRHALERVQERRQVAIVEAAAGIVGGQVGQHRAVDEQPDVDAVVALDHHQLLARRRR